MRYRHFRALLCSGMLLSTFAMISEAQITLDGSLGLRGPLDGPHYSIGPDVGQIREGNLFHSFERFNVPTGASATFTGPATIVNILSRVTGGEPSAIDGVLRSEIVGANLFLLNPSGVLFGPNARLEVSGSFHVSTADSLHLADGAAFSANLEQASVLTVAPPQAFGFLGPTSAVLGIQKSVLEVPTGQALSIIGGDVHLHGGRLAAPGGDITLIAMQAPGHVRLTGETTGGAARGHLRLSDHAHVDVSGVASGGVRLVGDRIEITASDITAITGARDGRPITVEAQVLLLSEGASLQSGTAGDGSAGAVTVRAHEVAIRHGGLIGSHTGGPGKGGAVTVQAEGLVMGAAGASTTTGIVSTADDGSTGDAGAVVVRADRLAIDGHGTRELTGIGSVADRGSTGNAGDTQVMALDLEVHNGGGIFSSTFGPGRGGTVTVQAERLVLTGIGAPSVPGLSFDPTAIASAAITPATGGAGDIYVRATTIELRSGGVISSSTHGPGNAGTVMVEARRLVIDGGEAPVFTTIASTAGIGPFAGGNFGAAGNIRVVADEIEIRGGGAITSATFGPKVAGTVVVQAHRLVITGLGSFILPGAPAPFASRIESSAEPGATGAGGAVRITTHTLTLTDHGSIATRSFSPTGDAGDITLRVEDTLELRGRALISTDAEQASGGNIALQAGSLLRLEDSTLSASVAGGAETVGGTLVLEAPFVVADGGQISANALAGMGGRIRIISDVFLADPISRVSASSTLGIQGTVDIQAAVTTLSGTIAPLPQAFISPAPLLPARCAARFSEGTTSSLVVGGRDAPPPEPGGLLPSPLLLGERLMAHPTVIRLPPQQNLAARFGLLDIDDKVFPRMRVQHVNGPTRTRPDSGCFKLLGSSEADFKKPS